MSQLNDARLSALETLTGTTGNVNDLEVTWLLTVVVAAVGNTLNDLRLQYYLENGATSGHINDAEFEWLVAQGYSGSLNDMRLELWAAGGPIPASAIRDRDGNVIRDRDGNIIEERT